MNGDRISTCIHCGRRLAQKTIAVTDGLLEQTWVHQNSGLMLCEQTVATPVLTETPAVLTGQVPVSGNDDEGSG